MDKKCYISGGGLNDLPEKLEWKTFVVLKQIVVKLTHTIMSAINIITKIK